MAGIKNAGRRRVPSVRGSPFWCWSGEGQKQSSPTEWDNETPYPDHAQKFHLGACALSVINGPASCHLCVSRMFSPCWWLLTSLDSIEWYYQQSRKTSPSSSSGVSRWCIADQIGNSSSIVEGCKWWVVIIPHKDELIWIIPVWRNMEKGICGISCCLTSFHTLDKFLQSSWCQILLLPRLFCWLNSQIHW